jgi:polar amino acid transport system permease protein
MKFKKYILSFAIIGSFLFFAVWSILFSAFSFGYTWDWSKVPSFFINTTQDKVEAKGPGRITDIVHKNGNSIITITSENIETKYRVKNNGIKVSIGDDVTKGEELGVTTHIRMGPLTQGLLITLYASFSAIVIAVFISFTIVYIYLQNIPFVNPLIIINLRIIRGIPLIWIMVFGYFFFSSFLDHLTKPFLDEIVPRLWVGILALAIHSGANISSFLIGEISSRISNEYEIQPSFITYIVNCKNYFVHESVNTIKDSSLLAYIAISELSKSTRIAISETYDTFETELVCILLYIIIVNLFFYSCSYLLSLPGRRKIVVP